MFEQWARIGRRFFRDVPSFQRISIIPGFHNRPYTDHHPVGRLLKYVKSFSNIGQQALYSMERLQVFCTQEPSNVFEFYVAHYLYDFLGRVKTLTDLMALMIDHIFELGIPEKDCSLERGVVPSALREKEPDNKLMRNLGSKLDRARNSWLRAFYELRNLVIHRDGLRFIIMGVSEISSFIHIAAGDLLRITDERELLEELLTRVGGNSLSRFGTIDPLRLCEELWGELCRMVEDINKECDPQIMHFISSKTS